MKENLKKLPYLEMTRDIWEKAGEIAASLRRKRITIPLSDLIVSALAISGGYEVFTIDPHFKQVHGLKFHNLS